MQIIWKRVRAISIDISGISPKYLQIMNYYQEKINSGELKTKDKLPTEEEICRFFNVSRITAGKALNNLASEGYIVKIQGKGSYVNASKMDMQLNSLQGFTEEMKSKGLIPSSRVLDINICEPDAEVSEKLGVDTAIKVYSISRIRFANEIALSLENSFIPFYLCPGLEKYDLTDSLYRTVHERFNITYEKASQCIEAGFIDRDTAKLLNVKAGIQALFIERITYLPDGRPFEYVKSIYRGDKYKFRVELHRK